MGRKKVCLPEAKIWMPLWVATRALDSEMVTPRGWPSVGALVPVKVLAAVSIERRVSSQAMLEIWPCDSARPEM